MRNAPLLCCKIGVANPFSPLSMELVSGRSMKRARGESFICSLLAKQSAGQTTIAATFRKGTPVADQVTAAEIYFSTFIAEHNLPFL